MVNNRLTIIVTSFLDIWTLGPAKGARSFYLILKGLAERGYEVHFIGPKSDTTEDMAYGLPQNVYVHRLGFTVPLAGFRTDRFWWEGIVYRAKLFRFLIQAPIQAWRIARWHRSDLVYGHENQGVLAGWLIAKYLRIPLVSRFKDINLYLSARSCFYLASQVHRLLAYRLPAELFIMTDNGAGEKELVKRLGIPSEKVRIWANGVDKNMYISSFDIYTFKKQIGVPFSNRIVLSVCRLDRNRGVHRLMSAAPFILSSINKLTFLIVGDGPERENLKTQALELGIESYVTFVGAISHHRVADFMHAADIFVSLYDTTNVANPLREAMVCGCCPVALDVGGTRELVRHNETGMLVNPHNVIDSLTSTIIDLLKDAKKRKRLAKAAKEYADKHFQTWEERIEMEVNAIEKLLKDKAKSSK